MCAIATPILVCRCISESGSPSWLMTVAAPNKGLNAALEGAIHESLGSSVAVIEGDSDRSFKNAARPVRATLIAEPCECARGRTAHAARLVPRRIVEAPGKGEGETGGHAVRAEKKSGARPIRAQREACGDGATLHEAQVPAHLDVLSSDKREHVFTSGVGEGDRVAMYPRLAALVCVCVSRGSCAGGGKLC